MALPILSRDAEAVDGPALLNQQNWSFQTLAMQTATQDTVMSETCASPNPHLNDAIALPERPMQIQKMLSTRADLTPTCKALNRRNVWQQADFSSFLSQSQRRKGRTSALSTASCPCHTPESHIHGHRSSTGENLLRANLQRHHVSKTLPWPIWSSHLHTHVLCQTCPSTSGASGVADEEECRVRSGGRPGISRPCVLLWCRSLV